MILWMVISDLLDVELIDLRNNVQNIQKKLEINVTSAERMDHLSGMDLLPVSICLYHQKIRVKISERLAQNL